MRTHIRRTIAVTAAGLCGVLVAGQVPAVQAIPTSPPTSPPTLMAGSPSPSISEASSHRPATIRTVTLVTGDKVRLSYGKKRQVGVHVTPGPGRDGMSFSIRRRGTSVTVEPSDVASLVARGIVDPRLFDVTGLVRQKYDDQHSRSLPLIVQRQTGAPTGIGTLLPNLGLDALGLDGLGLSAVRPLKSEIGALWSALLDPALSGRSSGRSLSGRSPSGSSSRYRAKSKGWDWLGTGVDKLWLDGRIVQHREPRCCRALLDRSLPSIGARAAWKRGLTGKGIRVAVLDTGIDQTHPDLREVVVGKRNFAAPGSDVVDRLGHGTHVASVIAGTGAASDGKYRGVAPGVKLLVGKVLADDGTGEESDLIAGMQWAVANGAKVVNLSLGGDEPSDGTDPVSRAVDRLGDKALFVAAAGNSGPDTGTIGSPGAARKALTVAAIGSTSKETASFSSRGPRLGDYLAKPDIAAPGVDIIAARAKGTEIGPLVGSNYTQMSGTSMAAPHVSAAAAILVQERPSWRPADIKAALMASSEGTKGQNGVYDVGAGRLDIAKAIDQQVYTTEASVSAYLKWPHRKDGKSFVSYRNRSKETLTMALSLDGGEGVLRLGASSVNVPPGKTVKLPIELHPSRGEGGLLYQARLIGRNLNGVVIRSPVTAFVEPESYDVGVDVVNRAGALLADPAKGFLNLPALVNLQTGKEYRLHKRSGHLSARVPKGSYGITEIVETPRGKGNPSLTLVSAPSISVVKNRTVALDARGGQPVRTVVDSKGAIPVTESFGVVEIIAGEARETVATVTERTPLYALPTPAVNARPYVFAVHKALAGPSATYELLLGQKGGIPANSTFRVRDQDLTRLTTDFGAPGVQQSGTWYHGVELPFGGGTAFTASFPAHLPGRLVHLISSRFAEEPLSWFGSVDTGDDLGNGWLTIIGPREHYRERHARNAWSRAAFGPTSSAFVDPIDGSPIMGLIAAPQNPALGGDFEVVEPRGVKGVLTLTHDGKLVGRSQDSFYVEAPVKKSGRYRAHLVASSRTPWSLYATRVSGDWFFRTAKNSSRASGDLPLLQARVTGAFDLLGRAPAGRETTLTLLVDGGSGSVATPEFAISTNDGASWKSVTLTPAGGGRWTTVVNQPDKGFVSWRASARDSAGNTVDVSSIRSYAVTPIPSPAG